jgi:antitoxin component YwqK of YwqJK toxin-antitoxin module
MVQYSRCGAVLTWLCAAAIAACSSTKTHREFYADGQLEMEGQLRNGIPVGTWIEWYPSGTKRTETSFVAGVEHGVRRHWFENGTPAAKASMKNGLRQGRWVLYFPNGQPQAESTYEQGVEVGIRREWYESGQVRSEATIQYGEQNGLRTFWYGNGVRSSVAEFRDDLKHGLESVYDDNGDWLSSSCYHINVETATWAPNLEDTEPSREGDPCSTSKQSERATVDDTAPIAPFHSSAAGPQ